MCVTVSNQNVTGVSVKQQLNAGGGGQYGRAGTNGEGYIEMACNPHFPLPHKI